MAAIDTSKATKESPAVVGAFSFDGQTISGPESYMRERGSAMIDRFNKGEVSEVVREGFRQHGDAVLALMVAVQTDYAGWKGERQMFGWAK